MKLTLKKVFFHITFSVLIINVKRGSQSPTYRTQSNDSFILASNNLSDCLNNFIAKNYNAYMALFAESSVLISLSASAVGVNKENKHIK